LFAAWEVGAWRVLRERMRFDLIVGASAGAWVGWLIAGGATPEEIARQWLDPRTAEIMRMGLHRSGWLRPEPLYEKARELYEAGRPRMPFALTLTELPKLHLRIVRGEDVRWEHLAATCSIPLSYPPVKIDGRRYVDGGTRGSLPLWAAEKLGADRAIGLRCLTLWPFDAIRRLAPPPEPSPRLHVTVIKPSRKLGSVKTAVVWTAANIERWIEQGAEDASEAVSSDRM
jgi:NTE family protein